MLSISQKLHFYSTSKLCVEENIFFARITFVMYYKCVSNQHILPFTVILFLPPNH